MRDRTYRFQQVRARSISGYTRTAIKPIGENARLQFRSEFFDAFNTPQFGQPNGIGWVNDSIVPDSPRMGETGVCGCRCG